MSTDLIGELLLPIIGISLSPILIIAVILVLTTKEAGQNGKALLLGWLGGLGALLVTLIFFTSLIDSYAKTESVVLSWIRIGFGICLLVLAFKKWQKRPKKAGTEEKLPKWMATIDQITLRKSLRLGAVLGGLNPKNIAFCLVAVTGIIQADLSQKNQIFLLTGFLILSSATIIGLVVFHTIANQKSTPVLAQIKAFMIKYNATIMTLLFILFGLLLLKEGASGI